MSPLFYLLHLYCISKNAFLRFSEEEREAYLLLFRRHIEYLKSEEKCVLDSIPE